MSSWRKNGPEIEMLDVVAVGITTVDVILKCDSYPLRGGTAFVHNLKRFIGGCAANFSICTSKLDLKAGLISRIGNDEEGRFALKGLAERSVDSSRVLIDGKLQTAKVFAIVESGGERTFFAFVGKSSITQLSENSITPQTIGNPRMLFGDGGAFFAEEPRAAIIKAMRVAKEKSVEVIFDPNLRIPGRELPEELRSPIMESIELSDILLAGEDEIHILTGKKTLDSATEDILSFGPQIVGVKLGSKGCKIFSKDQKVYCPAFEVNRVDTTGAGDAYNAGFTYGYLMGWDLKKIATFANAVGGLKVTREGGSSSPTLREVKEFISEHTKADFSSQ